LVYKINNYSLNYVVNLGAQYLTKEMKKLLEQSEKLMNSKIMQERIKRDRARLEAWEKSGFKSQFELLQKQLALVSPALIPKPLEDIAHTKKKSSVRYKAPEPEPEPETPKETRLRMLAEYQAYCRNSRENDGDFDYETLWECADEMRFRKLHLEYDTYSDAYRYAVNHYTVKDKPIKSIHSLRNAFDKEKHKGLTPLKSVPEQYK